MKTLRNRLALKGKSVCLWCGFTIVSTAKFCSDLCKVNYKAKLRDNKVNKDNKLY